MPDEGTQVVNIPVMPTYNTQREIFDSLGITEGLIQSLDIENWTRQLEALKEGYTSAVLDVRPGSYAVSYPEARVQGRSVRLGEVTVDDAQKIVEAASGYRVTIRERESEPGAFCLHTVSPIENAAFEAMHGVMNMYAEREPSGTRTITVGQLRDHMRYYRDFRASNSRRTALRTAIKNNLLKSLRESGKSSPPKITEWDAVRVEKFGEYFTNIKKGLMPVEGAINGIPLLPRGTTASRWWGIEPEVVHADGVDTPRLWYRKSDGSLRGLQYESVPSYSGPDPSLDTGVAPRTDHDEDCRSRVREDDCTCGECYFPCSCGYEEERRTQSSENTQTAEWNSPILRSYHSRGLEYLCEKIEYRNTNSTAGIHVHVSAADLTPDQVVQVGLMYTALEPLFEQDYKRMVRNYCREVTLDELVSRFRQAGHVKEQGALADVRRTFSSDRYFTVNVSALQSHGTIEFRAMGPRYNYEFLTRWAHFLREIVNMAKAEIPQKVWRRVRTFEDLIAIMAKYGRETVLPGGNVDLAVERLGGEIRRAPNQESINGVMTVFDDYTGDVRFNDDRF